MAYDENNVFAKVLRGEIPCHKIYEDADTLAFLDIMPRAQGHALVVTKEKARDFFDISPSGLAKLMAVVQKLAPKIEEAMGAEGVLIQQFNGAAAGQTVFHLHVHIIPRKEGEALKPHAGKMEDQAVLAATAEKIRKKLSAGLQDRCIQPLCHPPGMQRHWSAAGPPGASFGDADRDPNAIDRAAASPTPRPQRPRAGPA